MKIVCLGGGPAGVYLAISMKLRNSEHKIAVYERNTPKDTFGWGVVFSDQTMENLQLNDPISAQAIVDELVHWDYIDVHLHGRVERSGGHGFIGMAGAGCWKFFTGALETSVSNWFFNMNSKWKVYTPNLGMPI